MKKNFYPVTKKYESTFKDVVTEIDATKILYNGGLTSEESAVNVTIYNSLYIAAETNTGIANVLTSSIETYIADDYIKAYELVDDYLLNVNIPAKLVLSAATNNSVKCVSTILLNDERCLYSPLVKDSISLPLVAASSIEIQTSATNTAPIMRSYAGDANLKKSDSVRSGANTVTFNRTNGQINVVFANWVATNLTTAHRIALSFNVLLPKKYIKVEV